jgi:hypothetical protein
VFGKRIGMYVYVYVPSVLIHRTRSAMKHGIRREKKKKRNQKERIENASKVRPCYGN